jgi:two-component system chemotaxis sensor kinase CheA
MSVELDPELRTDFLAESAELMETLGAQLIELERRPQDRELLNAVFRGFHSIKGGAGFFALTPVVELCHAAEDVFNALRADPRALDATLMDLVLQAYGELQAMLQAVAAARPLPAACAGTVQQLRAAAAAEAIIPPEASGPAPTGKRRGRKAAATSVLATPAAPGSDPFGADEFEALLDQLHGAGAAPGTGAASPAEASPGAEPAPPIDGGRRPAAGGPDLLPEAATAVAVPAAGEYAPVAETSVRIDTQRLDQVLNLVGELVLVRNRLKTLGVRPGAEHLRKSLSELDFITGSLQNAVMQMRMQPIRKLFARFPRLAREIARKLGKQVEVELVGEETGLDKSLVEALGDPLLHMVRNAVDHGLELPAVRQAAAKPAQGRLTFSAQQAGDHIVVSVRDDGAGMDPERLRRKALEKGLLDSAAAARLSADECLQLIFLPGFSTKEQVSDLSGRGVGMDVVRSHIAALNGSVQVESKLGAGSCIHIRVPLTLAILPALMVSLGGAAGERGSERLYALPLQPVQDVFRLDESRVRDCETSEVVMYRQQALRLVRLSRWACVPEADAAHVVVVQLGAGRYGLVVQRVLGREEIVVKPLGARLRGLAGLAGATVTGEGRIALIVDLPGLVAAAGR